MSVLDRERERGRERERERERVEEREGGRERGREGGREGPGSMCSVFDHQATCWWVVGSSRHVAVVKP